MAAPNKTYTPTSGQPADGTQLNNDLDALFNALADGAVDDGRLTSPNNALRKVLLQSAGVLIGGAAGPNTYFFHANGAATLSSIVAGSVAGAYSAAPFWIGGTEFAVAGKTQRARVRFVIACNATAPGVHFVAGLYPVSSLSGAFSSSLAASLGSVVAGSTTPSLAPSGGEGLMRESGEFNLPTTATPHLLGVVVDGNLATNSLQAITLTLELYHS